MIEAVENHMPEVIVIDEIGPSWRRRLPGPSRSAASNSSQRRMAIRWRTCCSIRPSLTWSAASERSPERRRARAEEPEDGAGAQGAADV